MLKKILKDIRDYIALLTQGRLFYQRYFTLISEQNYKQDNKRLWNQLSKAYTRKYNNVVNSKYLDLIIKQFTNKQLNVLEFGCSSGMNLNYLYFKYPNNHYFGVDISDVAIELGRKKYHNITLENNLNKLDINRYDIIFTRAVLQHIDKETLKNIIKSFKNMLNKGGY